MATGLHPRPRRSRGGYQHPAEASTPPSRGRQRPHSRPDRASQRLAVGSHRPRCSRHRGSRSIQAAPATTHRGRCIHRRRSRRAAAVITYPRSRQSPRSERVNVRRWQLPPWPPRSHRTSCSATVAAAAAAVTTHRPQLQSPPPQPSGGGGPGGRHRRSRRVQQSLRSRGRNHHRVAAGTARHQSPPSPGRGSHSGHPNLRQAHTREARTGRRPRSDLERHLLIRTRHDHTTVDRPDHPNEPPQSSAACIRRFASPSPSASTRSCSGVKTSTSNSRTNPTCPGAASDSREAPSSVRTA
jgi:hypothetical protein